MYRKIKGLFGDAPIRLIATLLLAVLVPSVVVTGLGIVSVYEADRFVKRALSEPVARRLEAATVALATVWSERLAGLVESIADTTSTRPSRLEELREDPFVRDVLTETGGGLALVALHRPLPSLWVEPDHPELAKARSLELEVRDPTAARAEYLALLDRSTEDGVKVEALHGAARTARSLGKFPEALAWLREALAKYGDTTDATGVVRKLPILRQVIRLERQLDPEASRRSARILAALLGASAGGVAASVTPALLAEVEDLLAPEDLVLLRRGSGERQGGKLLTEEILPQLTVALGAGAGGASAPARIGELEILVVKRPGIEPMTFASFTGGRPDTTVHVLLDQSEFVREAAFQLEEQGIDLGAVRFARTGGGLLESEPPRAPQALAIRPLPPPFAHLELRYFPDPRSPEAGFRSFEVMTLATYTWAVLVLVATITVGVVLTLRSVLREMRTARLKSDFVSFISHELKTPLAAIRMFTETLLDGRVSDREERRTCLKLIDRESERLTQLIEKVIEYSRIERQEKVFQFTSASMEDLVHEAVGLFREHNKENPREIEVNSVQRISKMKMDRASMVELLLNLLSNAAKYSAPRKRIIVNLRETIDEITVEVVDQGVGIRKRDQKKIFEKFYRADDYLTRDVEGTGLGLAFSRYIARVHRGEIKVSSTPNAGSTFTLQLKKTHVMAE